MIKLRHLATPVLKQLPNNKHCFYLSQWLMIVTVMYALAEHNERNKKIMRSYIIGWFPIQLVRPPSPIDVNAS